MSDYPMLISNKLHSFRNFILQRKKDSSRRFSLKTVIFSMKKCMNMDIYSCIVFFYLVIPSNGF